MHRTVEEGIVRVRHWACVAGVCFKKVRSGCQDRLHHIFPNSIPSPYGDRDYFRKTDPAENRKTSLPDGESLDIRCLWGVELYGPSQIETLYERLKSLGWDRDAMTGDRSVVRWIRDQRMYGSVGHYNIGVAGRDAGKQWHGTHAIKRLPKEFDHVVVKIFQLSPSLTAVLVAFVLTDEASGGFAKELRRVRTTTRSRTWGQRGYRIHRPINLKIDAVRAERTRLRRLVVGWFEKEIPGIFCESEDGNRLPTAELLITSQQVPLPRVDETNGRTPEWLHIASLDSPFVTWVSDECSSFRLAEGKFEDDDRHHVVAAVRSTDLTAENLKYLGEPSPASTTRYCEERIDGILSHLAAIALLSEVRRGFSIRREMVKPKTKTRAQVEEALGELEDFFRTSIGLAAIATELGEISKQEHVYRWNCSGFVAQERRPSNDDTVPLSKSIQSRTSWLAQQVVSEESQTREVLEQFSTIMSTRESVRSQGRMEVLTIVTVILALISAVFAWTALKQ